jgi:MFS family permease
MCLFAGLACLVLFLPLHMREVGLNESHSRIISTVAPLVSILGPLIVGPASDRLGKHKVGSCAPLLERTFVTGFHHHRVLP